MMTERGCCSMRALNRPALKLERGRCLPKRMPSGLHHSGSYCESATRGSASGDHTNSFLFVSPHPQSFETCFSYCTKCLAKPLNRSPRLSHTFSPTATPLHSSRARPSRCSSMTPPCWPARGIRIKVRVCCEPVWGRFSLHFV